VTWTSNDTLIGVKEITQGNNFKAKFLEPLKKEINVAPHMECYKNSIEKSGLQFN